MAKVAETVTSYRYLWYTITSHGNDESAVNERIGLGWGAFSDKKRHLNQQEMFNEGKKEYSPNIHLFSGIIRT